MKGVTSEQHRALHVPPVLHPDRPAILDLGGTQNSEHGAMIEGAARDLESLVLECPPGIPDMKYETLAGRVDTRDHCLKVCAGLGRPDLLKLLRLVDGHGLVDSNAEVFALVTGN